MRKKEFKEEHSIYEVPKIEILEIVVEQSLASSIGGRLPDVEIEPASCCDPVDNMWNRY